MRSMLRFGALAVCVCALAQTVVRAQSPDDSRLAQQAVTELAAGQFAAVEQQFDPQLAQGVPEQILEMVWMHIEGRFGTFEKITGATTKPVNGQQLVLVACQFAKGPVTVAWTFNAQGKITNLHFQ